MNSHDIVTKQDNSSDIISHISFYSPSWFIEIQTQNIILLKYLYLLLVMCNVLGLGDSENHGRNVNAYLFKFNRCFRSWGGWGQKWFTVIPCAISCYFQLPLHVMHYREFKKYRTPRLYKFQQNF